MAPSRMARTGKKARRSATRTLGLDDPEVHADLIARKAAWLYAQFVPSKTVDVKKSHVGLTFIRDSTVRHESFYRTCAETGWSGRVLPLA